MFAWSLLPSIAALLRFLNPEIYLRFNDATPSTEIPRHVTATIPKRNLKVESSVKLGKKRLRQPLFELKRENEKPVIYIVMAMPSLQKPAGDGDPPPSSASALA
mmetsp:Transcript_23991/g.35677  ORF Transcript_23991/g.35677 Transcript_23991/m.35677 type:complete len:104 (+) Transcript_23991:529-840(+)